LRTSWRKRFTTIGIYLAGFLPWVLGWAIRNHLVADNVTNRTFVWHPITVENFGIGRYEVSTFLIPIEAWRREIFKQPYVIEALIIIILGVILVWTLLQIWKHISKPNQLSDMKRGGKPSREVISFTVALFIFAYLASIIASMTMFDAATKFKLRILSPVFVGLFILLIYAGVWLRSKNRTVVIVLTFLFLGLFIYKQSITVAQWSKGGLGYASFRWYDSEAMAYLRDLPTEIKIYTNEPGAVYLYVNRGAVVLPDRYDTATGLTHETDFEKGLSTMKAEINTGKAVLVLFDHGQNVVNDVPALTQNLHLAYKAQGDFIYTKP
jgi:hypothetical protein